MDKRLLYMRIGSDKAGTVSLAQLVKNNRNQFLKNGFYAPIRNCLPLYDHLVKENNLKKIDIFDSSKFLSSTFHRQRFNELIHQYTDKKNVNIFLTTETFWGRLSKKNVDQSKDDIIALCNAIKNFFVNHQIKIILNLRRIDLYIESLYKQELKAGRHISIAKLKDRLCPEKTYDLLLLLEGVFGKENIIIKPFERSQMVDGDLVADTLKILSLYEKINEFTITTENEGLHRDLCETLVVMNKEQGKLISNKNLIQISSLLMTEYNFPDIKYILSLKERKKLLLNHKFFYEYIENNYNYGKKFFIEPLPEDDHLYYKLSKDRFELIKNLILESHKNS